MTLEDSDRALIVETLEQAGWIVGGPNGAATKLGLKRTTLLARMRAYPSGRNQRFRGRARRCPDLRVEPAAAHGIKLEVSRCERFGGQP